MPLPKRFHSCIAYCLVLAMLWVSAWPVVSQWVSRQPSLTGAPGASWVQVCSVSGKSWVKVDAKTPAQPSAPLDHASTTCCDWCSVHVTHWSLATSTVAVSMPRASWRRMPAAFYASAHASFAWRPFGSRDPPAFS